jgi:hypothetical protein
VVPAALLLVTGLAGCGGDDDPEDAPASSLDQDEQTAADNLAAQIIRSGTMSQDTSSQTITDAQATCVAEGAVADVGLESLQKYRIVTKDLLVNKSIQGVEMNADDADALAGVFVTCIDAEALFEQRFLDAMPSGGSAEERRTCVQSAVDEDAVREILAASFEGRGTGAYATMQEDVSSCAGGKARGQ